MLHFFCQLKMLCQRIFTGEYERLFGSDAEKAETEKAQ